MSFRWNDFLELATQLSVRLPDDRLTEARFRSAISRAYYAAFCSCRQVLQQQSGTAFLHTENIHAMVRLQLKQSTDPDHQRMGALLHRLRRLRNQADYDEHVVPLESQVWESLTIARDILAQLGSPP